MKKLFLLLVLFVLFNLTFINASSISYQQEDLFFFDKFISHGTETIEKPIFFFSTPYERIINSYQDGIKKESAKIIVKAEKNEIKKKVPQQIIITENIIRFESVTIDVNQEVIWKNEQEKLQALVYGVREISGMRSGFIQPGESFTWQFSEPGEYTYVDSVVIGRMGKITVNP
jgi:plastocyanin